MTNPGRAFFENAVQFTYYDPGTFLDHFTVAGDGPYPAGIYPGPYPPAGTYGSDFYVYTWSSFSQAVFEVLAIELSDDFFAAMGLLWDSANQPGGQSIGLISQGADSSHDVTFQGPTPGTSGQVELFTTDAVYEIHTGSYGVLVIDLGIYGIAGRDPVYAYSVVKGPASADLLSYGFVQRNKHFKSPDFAAIGPPYTHNFTGIQGFEDKIGAGWFKPGRWYQERIYKVF